MPINVAFALQVSFAMLMLFLQNIPHPNDEQIKDWLSSNICRCTGYEGIKNAIDEAIKE